MDPDRIRALLDARPFVPFAMKTTRIGTIAVPSPGLALLARTAIYVGQDVGADGLPDRVAPVPLAQVTSLVVGG